MYNADFTYKSYQQIKFVEGEVDSMNITGPIRIQSTNEEQGFTDIDKVLQYLIKSNKEDLQSEDALLEESPALKNSSKNLLDLYNKLSTIMKCIDHSDFNAFLLDKASNYNPLYFILMYFYRQYEWKSNFNIPIFKMSNFSGGI
jgi:hypothetical protein